MMIGVLDEDGAISRIMLATDLCGENTNLDKRGQ